jgi:hypothetical protein
LFFAKNAPPTTQKIKEPFATADITNTRKRVAKLNFDEIDSIKVFSK